MGIQSGHGVKTQLIGEVDPTLKPSLFRPPVNMPRKDVRDAGEEAPRRLRRSRDKRDRPYASQYRQRRSVNVRALRPARVGARHAVVWCPLSTHISQLGKHTRSAVSRPEHWNGLKGRLPVKMPREDGARDARQGASGRHAGGESPKCDVNQPPSKPRGKRCT